MRKCLSVSLMLLLASNFMCSSASAQKARQKEQPKEGPKAKSKNEAPPVAKRNPRDTAVRMIAVAPLAPRGDITPDQANNLTKQVVNDLNAKTFLQGTSIAASIAARAEMLKAVTDANLDGVLIGLVSEEGVRGSILSRTGEVLTSYAVELELSLTNDAQVKAAARAVVDEIARAIPYRGFVTKKLQAGQYEINLGKNQGLLPGQRFHLFELSSGRFNSSRDDLGEVEVMAVGDDTAAIEPTGSAVVKPFAKVGYFENARGMSVPEQVETRGYAHIGGGLLNISGSGDPKYIDRAYNVSSTPTFLLGGGWSKYTFDVLFAQAKGDDTDLVYTEVLLSDRVVDLPFGGLNRFSVWIGGRGGRVSVTTKRNVISALQSTTSISPEFDARLDRIIKGPVRGYIAASAYFPIFVSGIDTSAILFSYGLGGLAGLSLDLSQRVVLDVGARYHLIRRPVDGQSSVTETYTELFGDIGYRF